MDKYLNDVSPQYIVGTTKLVGLGYTMTEAKRLVQLDPEWMGRDELQARKRINRITQTARTYSYSLCCPESKVEEVIFDRQGRRGHMLALSLDPANIDGRDITRGIGDDEFEEEGSIQTISSGEEESLAKWETGGLDTANALREAEHDLTAFALGSGWP